jgi:hypothetical protein
MMKDVKWSEPVLIALENGMPRKFQCVYDAYDFLLHEWALPLGQKYQEAVTHCHDAVFGNGCREMARAAFVSLSSVQNRLIEPEIGGILPSI